MNEAKIVNDCYNYVKWLLPIVARYPRNYRYSLGLRIENAIYELLELLQKCYLATNKQGFLTEASFKLEHLRLLIRISHDMHLFDNKVHHAMIEQMDNIGKQLGGWIKSRINFVSLASAGRSTDFSRCVNGTQLHA